MKIVNTPAEREALIAMNSDVPIKRSYMFDKKVEAALGVFEATKKDRGAA
jgi:hypothetical protein